MLKPLMTVFGLKNQAEQIQEAFRSGDPVKVAVSIVEMFCMLFGLTSQCFTGDTLVSAADEPVKVCNLEIEDSHTYYVSADGVLVHNRCKSI